jgi:signal transduction histidine kinase
MSLRSSSPSLEIDRRTVWRTLSSASAGNMTPIETSCETPAMTVRPRVRLSVLVAGFVASVALVLLVSAISLMEVSRAQRDVMGSFETGERTTYLLGHFAKQVLRSHLMLGEAVSGERAQLEPKRTEVLTIHERITTKVDELLGLLSSEERREWSAVAPLFRELQSSHLQTLNALERGDRAAAELLLRGSLPLALQISAELTKLSQRNQREIQTLLLAAERRLRFVWALEGVLGGALLIGITMSWVVVIQVLLRQERRLDEFVTRIEAANRDLDAFAGRIAHDLRNVFSPIGLTPARLRAVAGDPAAVETVAHGLQRASSRAVALLDGLLAFSRAGEPSAADETACVRQAIDECMEDAQILAERMGATVSIEVTRDHRVRISPSLLHVALANLLSNALKFLEGRELRRVRISAATDTEREQCSILVEDSGPGIEAESLSKLFEPFYRAPGTLAPGTGIGLATVQRIVLAHGGGISVSSELGNGARFELKLPLAE